jgi:PAS domain S-box-containing protein
MNSTDDWIWSVDSRHFGLLTFNDSFRQYFENHFGIKVRAGMPSAELMQPDLAARWNGFYARTLTDGAFETEYVVATGTKVLLLASRLLKRGEEVFGISIFGKDITSRRQAESELMLLNRLYALLSRVNECIVRSNSDQELFQGVCEAAVQKGEFKLAWVGVADSATKELIPVASAGAAAGVLKTIKVYFDERPEGCNTAGECIRSGKLYVSNDFINDPSNRHWWDLAREHGIGASASLPILAAGQVLGALMIYNDTTDCFMAKELALLGDISSSLSFALEGLAARHKTAQLSRAVEQSPVSIVITNRQGDIEYVNPKFLEVTGYSLEEVMGKNPRFLKPLDSTSLEARQYKQLWATILARGEWHGEFRNRKKNGELYWEVVSISPITDRAGRIRNFLAVKEDITKHKLLEDEFRQAQKMEAFGRLAAGVAHDFNNLLTAIMGNTEIVNLEGPLNAAQKESIVEISKAVDRAANLTRQLLLFSRRKAMHLKRLDVNEVVANLGKLLGRLIGEHISLREECDPGDMHVLADSGMLEQVLMNLAVNSRDALPQGGELTIKTANVTFTEATDERRVGRYVCLSVKDTGVGMPPEVLEHIFEPFFTTKEVGKGTGLGLATVFGIVEQHHGWIEVQSQLGRGTTFDVYLPHHEASEDTKFIQRQKAGLQGGTETILLVEDEAAVRTLARALLNRIGYTVHDADSPKTALEIWDQYQADIDLVFTDIVMPGHMNGWELGQQLLREKPGLKVIYTSGYNDEMPNENSRLRHASNFLPKPYTPELLLQTIRLELDK